MNKSKIEKIKNDEWFKSPWSYKKAWQLKGTPYWGYFHTYWAGGELKFFFDCFSLVNIFFHKKERTVE